MCGLFGLMTPSLTTGEIDTLVELVSASRERGSDAIGWAIFRSDGPVVGPMIERKLTYDPKFFYDVLVEWEGVACTIIGNVRAEPTTEWFDGDLTADEGHPFYNGSWAVVHNGVIANDKELESQGYKKSGSRIDSAVLPALFAQEEFIGGLKKIVGSYAILAVEQDSPGMVYLATTYKPLYTAVLGHSRFFASQAHHFPLPLVPLPIDQYTATIFSDEGTVDFWSTDLYPPRDAATPVKVVIIHSGGLDSTVVAASVVQEYGAENVTLLHFQYGCRAQVAEGVAVNNVAHELRVRTEFIDVESLFAGIASSSPLLDARTAIRTDGDAGAEFAYEWVPARNFIFLALATAYAENTGAEIIYTGTNLEESGAYPDNEPEFITRLNHALPYAVADGKRMVIEDPLGNLMKHQIVRYGLEIEAPMHLAWSCYYGGARHCGECGPCKMRRTAFKMNQAEDSVSYASTPPS